LAKEGLANGRARNKGNGETNQTNDADCELTTHKPTRPTHALPDSAERRYYLVRSTYISIPAAAYNSIFHDVG
jgi:hypothetical protein